MWFPCGVRSSLNAKVKKRPSVTALFNVGAFILEREDQKAAIHGRTLQ
jgi:hypothetical protein